MMKLRRTKIVATLGPASSTAAELERMISAGMDVARINFSHGGADRHRKTVTLLREQAEKLGRHVAVLIDLRGPKIRIEGFKEDSIILEDGAPFILDPGLGTKDGDLHGVGISHHALARDVRAGDVLLLDDGNIVLEVTKLAGNVIECRVINGGRLSSNKGLNRLGGGLSMGALTQQDESDIAFAAELGADYLAVSFVRDAGDIHRARELRARRSNP